MEQLLLPLAICLVLGGLLYLKNSRAERLCRQAQLVLKHKRRSLGYGLRVTSTYELTFQFEDSSQQTYSVPWQVYVNLSQGQRGQLITQGTEVIEFQVLPSDTPVSLHSRK